MISLKQVLSRADSSLYQRYVGADAIRVIRALDPRNERPGLLRDIFLNLQGDQNLLENIEFRTDILDLLRQDEASTLALALGLNGEPFSELKKQLFRKGSHATELLWNFFGLAIPTVEPVVEEPSASTVLPQYRLFDHQYLASMQAYDCLSDGRKRVMLHMPTGSGKTRMAMHIVSRFLVENGPTTVIWLANSEELCDQAADEFERAWSFLGNRSVTLNRYWGRHDYPTAFTSDGLVVGGFPKLFALARRSPPAIACLGDLTGLLVIDEAHQAIAPTYELIIQGLAARSIDMPILGLSATPGRSWNDPDADKKLADFFSQKKVTLNIPGYENPIDFLVTQGYLAKPNFRSIQHTTDTVDERDWGNLETELDIPLAILKMLAADEVRTIRIIREIEELCQRHSRIIVFATTVLHADLICAILTTRNISAECITSKTVSSERSRKIAWYKANHDGVRVIVNFGVLTTGFDAPLTSATLIARPTKSLVLYSQMVGRAIRGPKAGGNREAEVVTVVDTKLAGFGDLAEAFKNWEDVW